MSKFERNTKGITLIALVVTIIVLLLLAGISITMLTGQNGILTRVDESKEQYVNSSEKEQVQLSYNSAMTKKLGNVITAEELQNELDEDLGKNADGTSKTETTDIGDGVFNVRFFATNHNYKVDTGVVTLLAGEDKSVVEPKNIGDWEYDVNDDGTLTITGYKGSDTEVVIPNHIGGVAVKRIYGATTTDISQVGEKMSIWCDDICSQTKKVSIRGSGMTKAQDTIKRIKISYGIEEIGGYTFIGSTVLENVEIPSSVKTIGSGSWGSCTKLRYIKIPEGVEKIGQCSFWGCIDLTVEVPIASNEEIPERMGQWMGH